MKRPEKLLAKRKFAAVMQISDELHRKLMEPSANETEDLGIVGIKNGQVTPKIPKMDLVIGILNIPPSKIYIQDFPQSEDKQHQQAL